MSGHKPWSEIKRTRIPLDPNGYSVNPNTGTIHTRYADHGNGQRTRTQAGARSILGDTKPTICRTCYPSTRSTRRPPPSQQNGQLRRKDSDAPTLHRVRNTDPQDTVPSLREPTEHSSGQ